MSNSKLGGIYIELDGKQTNIKELDKEDYEQFLELMHKLRIAYTVIMAGSKTEPT